MSRFVLTRAQAAQAARPLRAEEIDLVRTQSGVRILDSTQRMLLVEADEDDVSRLRRELAGWIIRAEGYVPLPDTRPRISQETGH